MLVLNTIIWTRRWRRKRRNMWVHPINIKRTEFGIFCHSYRNMLKNEEKFRGFFRMIIEQFYRLSQLVGGEIRKQNTNYKRAISPEERLQQPNQCFLLSFRTYLHCKAHLVLTGQVDGSAEWPP